MRHVLRLFFDMLPDLAGILLAAFSFAVIFMSDLVKKLEELRFKWFRRSLASVCILVGVGGVISNSLQKSEQKEKSETERKELRGQIGQLISSAQIQATGDDIKRLDTHIGEGFANVTAAIKGVRREVLPPQVAAGPQLPPALAQHLTFTQRRAPSSNPALPYGLQVIIQTNINIQPVGFAFVCTGEVGDINFFIAGQGAYMNVQTGIAGEKKTIGFVKFSFPPLTPETPMVVTLLSKGDIRVTEVQQMH